MGVAAHKTVDKEKRRLPREGSGKHLDACVSAVWGTGSRSAHLPESACNVNEPHGLHNRLA